MQMQALLAELLEYERQVHQCGWHPQHGESVLLPYSRAWYLNLASFNLFERQPA
jgi:hypothetical protein